MSHSTTFSFDLILKNGTLLLPGLTVEADIGIKDGKIADIGNLSTIPAAEIRDCTGLHILPGIIDTQVHFREPGADHKEVLETGMMAAAMGGVTSIFEMPNTNPLTTSPEAITDKLARAAKTPWVNYAFYLGGTVNNAPHLTEWESLPGICGIKIFMGSSTGDLLAATDTEVEAIFASGRRLVAVHAEDEMMMIENKKTILGESHDVAMHPVWRSPESCLSATQRVVRIAKKYNRRVHVLHITTAQEMEFLAQHKDIATAEVLANHLTLHAPDCYEKLGTKAQQNPPIREKHHQNALWRGIANGTVDMIASDHAPHTREEKAKTYPASPSGTPGVQTLLPVMLNHVNAGRLTLEKLVELMCYGPQRVHGIVGKGRLARGYDADITVIDLKKEVTLKDSDQKSRAGWTPFDGMKVKGIPVMTLVHGRTAMHEGTLLDGTAGQAMKFIETKI
ncbi:MAG: dihydroorotase [Pseudobdellovibrionaceae bacterium]